MKNTKTFKNKKTLGMLALVLMLVATAFLLVLFGTSPNAYALVDATESSYYDTNITAKAYEPLQSNFSTNTFASAYSSASSNFDAYTDSRDFILNNDRRYSIHQYLSNHHARRGRIESNRNYFSEWLVNFSYADDAIVSMVPRELFRRENQTLHIGRYYGFFISTTPMYDNFRSTVMVFDITNTIEIPSPNNIAIRVQPIFQLRFAFLRAGSGRISFPTRRSNGVWERDITTTLSYENLSQNRVIAMPMLAREHLGGPIPLGGINRIAYYGNVNDYYLKDISFVTSLLNEQEANHWHDGYNPRNDKGMMIIGFDYIFHGIIRTYDEIEVSGDSSSIARVILSTTSFVLGLFPPTKPVALILSATLLASSWYRVANVTGNRNPYSVTPTVTPTGRPQFSGDNFSTTRNGQATSYRDIYGREMLIKTTGVVANPDQTADTNVWFGVGHYAELALRVYFDDDEHGRPLNTTRLIREVGMRVARATDGRTIARKNVGTADFLIYGVNHYRDFTEVQAEHGEDGGAVRLYNHNQNTSSFRFYAPQAGIFRLDFADHSHRNWFDFRSDDVEIEQNSASMPFVFRVRQAGYVNFALDYRRDDISISRFTITTIQAEYHNGLWLYLIYEDSWDPTFNEWMVSRGNANTSRIVIPSQLPAQFGGRVTRIANRAFYRFSELKSIYIPNTVVSIGNDAFAHTGLTSVQIPDTVGRIGRGAFAYADLSGVRIPVNLVAIEYSAFRGNRNLAYVDFAPNARRLLEIENSAFAFTGLTSIDIPSSVEVIGNSAFRNTHTLEVVNFAPDSRLHTIRELAFSHTGITSIEIPSYYQLKISKRKMEAYDSQC